MAFRRFPMFAYLFLLATQASGLQLDSSGAPRKSSVVSLVPAANWQLRKSEKLDVSAISQWGGDPAVDREYGVKAFGHSTYELMGKTANVVIEEGPDASAAYGLFSYYRNESMTPVKGIELAASGPGVALVARDRAFIRVLLRPDSPPSQNDLRALLISIAGTRPSQAMMASLPPGLPSPGLIPGSEKYLMGPEASRHVLMSGFNTDLIDFPRGAEAEVGQYRLGNASKADPNQMGRRATVLAITYPTPQIAQERFGAMQAPLEINQDRGTSSVYGKRKGSFVILTFNAEAGTATRLLSMFNVSEQVSWDQRYPEKKPVVWQMVELVLANFFLAFILAAMAVIGGVLIALSKRAAGKWFPEWEWGNPDGETLTTLKLR
jgi:hypothetical protein